MFSLYRILLTLHDLNHGLALLIGAWAVAQIILGSRGNQAFSSTERRSLMLFTGTLYLQAVLGLLLYAVMHMQNIPIFSGRSGVLVGHTLAGVLAIVFSTLAIVLNRKGTTNRLLFRAAALCGGLALLVLGNLLGIVALLGLALLIQLAIVKRRNDHPAVQRSVGSSMEKVKR